MPTNTNTEPRDLGGALRVAATVAEGIRDEQVDGTDAHETATRLVEAIEAAAALADELSDVADLPHKPRPYCTQPRAAGEGCETCSLVSYGRDCQNNPIE